MKMKFYQPSQDEGEVIASWGEAELIRYLDGKSELRGGSKEDRLAARSGSRSIGMRLRCLMDKDGGFDILVDLNRQRP